MYSQRPNLPYELTMVDIVKESFDIKLNDVM